MHSWKDEKSGWNFHFNSDFSGNIHMNPSGEGWEEQCIEIPMEALKAFMTIYEERIGMKNVKYYEIMRERCGFTDGTGIAFGDEATAKDFVSSEQYKECVAGVDGEGKSIDNGRSRYREREVIVFQDIDEYDNNSYEIDKLAVYKRAKTVFNKKELKVLGIE